MVVRIRKRGVEVLPYRAMLWTIVAVLLAAGLLHVNPVTLGEELDAADGTEITHEGDADILVVVDYEAIRQSGESFQQRDFSAAWIDLIHREVGPASVATPETFSADLLDSARAVILSHSVSTEMPDASIDRIREFALDGGTVVVERPDNRLRELFSADGEVGPRSGRQITHAEGVADDVAGQFEQMPLFTDYIGSTSPRDDATTLLSIDGAPAIYAADFGDGSAVTVDFDLPRQLVTLRQGRPDDDFSLRIDDDRQRPPTTAELVADDELLGADVPYADMLERFVIYGVLVPHAGIPALWAYPDGADGAVAFVHEDSRLGDGGAWMLDHEQDRGGSSTLMTSFDSGITEDGAEAIQADGGHLGLAWRPPHPSLARFETMGIGGFEPLRAPIGLGEQRDHLADIVARGGIRTSRAMDGIWSSDWSASLAHLAYHGITSDISYEAPSHRGFAFGTGRPFVAMNNKGLPLSLRQYPISVPSAADEGPPLEALLEQSSSGHHQLLTVSSRPSRFADYPDIGDFERWLRQFDAITRHNHAILNISEYAQFQRQRRDTSLRSRLDEGSTLPGDLDGGGDQANRQATLLRITAEVSQRGMMLVIPDRLRGAEFHGALEGVERVGSDIVTNRVDTEESTLAGLPVRKVALDRGFNNFEFYYR